MECNKMKHIKNDEAVSPVIGVILMVVITVIIAAVLAVFAFGIGTPAKVPTTHLKMEMDFGNPNQLYITNTGGDTLKLDELYITITNQSRVVLVTNENMSFWSNRNGSGLYFAPGNTTHGNISENAGLIPQTNDILEVLITHIPTGQSIADTKVTVR